MIAPGSSWLIIIVKVDAKIVNLIIVQPEHHIKKTYQKLERSTNMTSKTTTLPLYVHPLMM